MAIRRRWDIQIGTNPWLSLGLHIDHNDPSLTLHLPGFIICLGRCKQPGFPGWHLSKKLEDEVGQFCIIERDPEAIIADHLWAPKEAREAVGRVSITGGGLMDKAEIFPGLPFGTHELYLKESHR